MILLSIFYFIRLKDFFQENLSEKTIKIVKNLLKKVKKTEKDILPKVEKNINHLLKCY